jgi:methyl-accepting chemotaxis protein
MGYSIAAGGLRAQAEAASGADAQLVSDAIDQWHTERLDTLKVLARVPSLAAVLQAGESASPTDKAAAQAELESLDGVASDIDSVGLMDSTGTFVLASDKATLGAKNPQRDYFQAAMKGQPFITGVAISTITNQPAIFHSVPVTDASGRVVGVLRSRSSLEAVQRAVEAARDRVGEGARGVLLDSNGLVIASSVDPDWLLRPVAPLTPEVQDALVKGTQWGKNPPPQPLAELALSKVVGAAERTSFKWNSGGIDFHAVAQPLRATTWSYVSALPVQTVEAAANDFLRKAALAALVGLLLASVGAVLAARPIAAAVRRLSDAARGLAMGDLDQTIEARSKDEVGEMAAAFRQMAAYQREMARIADAMAGGDLTHDVTPKCDRDAFGLAFAGMVANLRELVGQVQSSAIALTAASQQLGSVANQTGSAVQQVTGAVQNVAAGAGDTSRTAQEGNLAMTQLGQAVAGIARGAAEQAQQVQAASASSASMAEGVAQVSVSAKQVADSSQRTKTSAEVGWRAVQEAIHGLAEINTVVRDAADKVQELGRLSQKIGTVVETIDDIAEQTNLLALNAAIEAARAGEHGRGFAVVADEVRKLAERSSRETRQIGELIRAVQQGTSTAVSAIEAGTGQVQAGASKADQAGTALREILTAVEGTVDEAREIASSAENVSAAARSVTAAMQAISAVTDENTASTEEMAAQAEQVTSAIQAIATVSEEQSGATEEVSASAEEMSAQVEELTVHAQELLATAEHLQSLVARFKLGETPTHLGGGVPRLRLVA